jgi:hypothetical protein
LLLNSRAFSTKRSSKRSSCDSSRIWRTMPKRVASAPYFATRSIGSITLPEALRHLAALVVEHERRDEHVANGMSPANFKPEHHHARDPKER